MALPDRSPAPTNPDRPVISPFCTDLLSKKVLGSNGLPMQASDVLDGSRWCWCGRTGQILGPDRQVAEPESCRKGRSCFDSPFASLL
jgi:hypothetical protein